MFCPYGANSGMGIIYCYQCFAPTGRLATLNSENQPFNMKNLSIRYGFLGGAAVVFYFLLIYFFRKELLLSPAVQWASLLFYIAVMWKAAQLDCAENSTARDIREIIRTPFTVFLLVNLCYWLMYYGLILADREILELQNAHQVAYFKAELDKGPGDPEQANRLRQQIQFLEKTAVQPALGPVLMQMARGALGGFGIAAAIAAYLKYFKD